MANKKPLLVFDFDGVISNSVHDSFLTAVNTFIHLNPGHRFPLSNPLTPDTVFEFEKQNPELFQGFSVLIALGNRAEDYLPIMTLLDRGDQSLIRRVERLDSVRDEFSKEVLTAFQQHFYDIRSIFQKSDPDGWLKLTPPFPGIIRAIERLSRIYIVAIATSKDRPSINLHLTAHRLFRYIDPDHILDKDFASSKRDHLIRFHEMLGTPFPDMHFIDDKVLHLISVKDLGVNNYLSAWGFNTKREHELAVLEGFVLLDLEDLHSFEKVQP